MVTRSVELAGVAVIVGGLLATAQVVALWWSRAFEGAYTAYRRNLDRAILLGLELSSPPTS